MAGKISPYAALLLLVQLTIGCSDQTSVPQPVRNQPLDATTPPKALAENTDTKLIVAFGDSLLAGYGMPQGQGFAPALERALAAEGVRTKVVNASVSGDTTAGGLQRLAFTLDGLERKPDLVIVGLGANDMLRGLDPEKARANLDAILGELKVRHIDAMLAGMLATPNLGPDYAAKFNPIYPALARKYQVPLYPFLLAGVTGRARLLLPDGLHPNENGVDEIVRRILPTIAQATSS